jgi:hypothetical protein
MNKPSRPEPPPMYGRLPWEPPRELAASLDRLTEAAFFGLPLIDLSPMSVDPTRPSAVRVFGKSLHVLAGGWLLAVVWLWLAGLQQALLRDGGVPQNYGLPLLLVGTAAGIVLATFGYMVTARTGRAPNRRLERREWHHAFWWSFFPNAMLWVTVYLMIGLSY